MNLMELFIKISADSTPVKRSLNDVQKTADSTNASFSRVDKSAMKTKKSFDELSTPVKETTENFKDAGESAESMQRPVKKLGDSVDKTSDEIEINNKRTKILIDNYKRAEERAEQLAKQFLTTARRTGDLSDETKELAKELDRAEAEAKAAKSSLAGIEEESDSASVSFTTLGAMFGKIGAIIGAVADALLGAFGFLQGVVKSIGDIALKTLNMVAGAAAAAATAAAAIGTASIKAYAEMEQLVGGAEKIFDEIDIKKIVSDANRAFRELGISASQYLSIINDVGATFSATMGDEKGYETARIGLLAISDYASGTGKSVDELSSKFTLITRSTSSYQSIADQFSGILPATSEAFLEQAKAAGILSESYKSLSDVPVEEYQYAVARSLESGVKALGLSGNTMAEATSTLSGSFASTMASWNNFLSALSSGEGIEDSFSNFLDSSFNFGNLIVERVRTIIRNLPDAVDEVISRLPQFGEFGKKIFVAFDELFRGKGPDIAESLLTALTDSMNAIASDEMFIIRISDFVVSVGDDLMFAIAPLLPKFVGAGIDLFFALLDGFLGQYNANREVVSGYSEDLMESLVNDLAYVIRTKLMEHIPETIAKFFSEYPAEEISEASVEFGIFLAKQMLRGFENIGGYLLDALEGALKYVSDNFEFGIDFGNIFSFGVGVDGSHYNGLDYVPFDGYIAELHEGERVLTKKEAEAYNRGVGGVSVVQNIYSQAKSAADLMQEAIYMQERAVLLGV